MERNRNTFRDRISALTAFSLGLALGLIAVWLYWLQRRVEREVVKTEEATPFRVRVSPPAHEPEPDDLTRIEGIGPKFASVLRSAGISTYEQLAVSDVDGIRDILRERGLYFADPTTWPEQAELATTGAWDALYDLQEELTAGRRS
jgi:predicted flap endonuclease-1-like 5' DNA nuclease